jgi:uncharacterized protein (DUF1778 family)
MDFASLSNEELEVTPMTKKKDTPRKISLELPPDVWGVLGIQAILSGQTLDKYVLDLLKREARRIKAATPTTYVSERGFKFLLKLLREPPRPNAALRRAAKRYREQFPDAFPKQMRKKD